MSDDGGLRKAAELTAILAQSKPPISKVTDAIVALAEAHAAHVLRELKETLDEDADRTPVGRDPFDFGKAMGLATAIDAIDELLDVEPHGIEVPK